MILCSIEISTYPFYLATFRQEFDLVFDFIFDSPQNRCS